MDSKVLVCYRSVTGFTRQYAEMIAAETGGALMDLRDVTARTVSQYDTVVFGGRCYAGSIDGLKRAKRLAAEGGAKTFVIFATGATPNAAEEMIRQAWEKVLTSDELQRIPHFYMQGGLCYEKMPLPERWMMRAFAAVMKDRAEMLSHSYDISSKAYIEPLVSFLKGQK